MYYCQLRTFTYNTGLQGYSQFQVAVAAQTAKGTGPYAMASVVQTPVDGKSLADISWPDELDTYMTLSESHPCFSTWCSRRHHIHNSD